MRGGVATPIEQERIRDFARVGSKKNNTHATSHAVTTAFVKRNKTHVTCHAVTTAFVKRAVTTASSLNNWLAVNTASSSHN
jgi:hypothetical protein